MNFNFCLYYLPNKSCCGNQLNIFTFGGSLLSIVASLVFSHFQKTIWGILAKTRMKEATTFGGIDDTGIADPRVNTMNPCLALSANAWRSYQNIKIDAFLTGFFHSLLLLSFKSITVGRGFGWWVCIGPIGITVGGNDRGQAVAGWCWWCRVLRLVRAVR